MSRHADDGRADHGRPAWPQRGAASIMGATHDNALIGLAWRRTDEGVEVDHGQHTP